MTIVFLVIQETRIYFQPNFDSGFSIDKNSLSEDSIQFTFEVAFENMPCSTLLVKQSDSMKINQL